MKGETWIKILNKKKRVELTNRESRNKKRGFQEIKKEKGVGSIHQILKNSRNIEILFLSKNYILKKANYHIFIKPKMFH